MARRVKLSETAVAFVCPGCGRTHVIPVNETARPRWDWNGQVDAVTLTPSILATWNEPSDDPELFDDPAHDQRHICHSYVRDGYIEFLADCSHSLSGQTVQLTAF